MFSINEGQTSVAGSVTLPDDKTDIEGFITFYEGLESNLGLSCNQCNKDDVLFSKNCFVFKKKDSETVTCFVNPVLNSKSGVERWMICECHSAQADKKAAIQVNNNVDITYYDIDNNLVNESLEGHDSHMFQHLYNHVQGFNDKCHFVKTQSRNELCNCESGLKYHECCMGTLEY